MRITILGSGALACLFGARLAGVAEVTLLARSAPAVAAIQREGLRVEEAESTQTARVRAVTDCAAAGPADLALVLVKSHGTPWAAEQAARVLAPDGLALTLQNGLGNAEALAGMLTAGRVWQGVTAQGATLLAPGHVRHAGQGPTQLAARPDRPDFAGQVVGLFCRAGLPAELVEDVQSLLWGKLVINAGINALTALLRVPNGVLAESPAARAIMSQVVSEALAVAQARGLTLPYEDAEARVLEVCLATAANRSSMLQDALAGRPTEVDQINGALLAQARACGLAAPYNALLVDLVHALEETGQRRIADREVEA